MTLVEMVPTDVDVLRRRLHDVLPAGVDEATLRVVDESSEWLAVRRGTVLPARSGFDGGAMLTIWADGGVGHAATSDVSDAGLRAAAQEALRWARATAGRTVPIAPPSLTTGGVYASPVTAAWDTTDLADRIELLRSRDAELDAGELIVDRSATLGRRDVHSVLVSTAGGAIDQRFAFTYPMLAVTAARGGDAQTRTYGAGAFCGQGGAEVLDRFGFHGAAAELAAEAITLLDAPNCPTGTMDLVLAPDQMVLQIHESIGHPLELDRILGDERNYAGTSFVTPDMFGEFQYGSELLNVTFDPTVEGQLASYAFDDDGTPATKQHLIRNGILERPLGGTLSQQRAGLRGDPLDGVANSRACSWNRPPIDRMANLNVEPGTSSFDDLIGEVEYGVFLRTNTSWSIDDSRNKFQFSTEIGQVIRDGQLAETVRNPSYRGISREFWRNLSGVGDASTFAVMGTPNCGKGELNQMIGTGHASPVCRFGGVEVFGADQ